MSKRCHRNALLAAAPGQVRPADSKPLRMIARMLRSLAAQLDRLTSD